MNMSSFSMGPLILSGGEGYRPKSAPVWEGLRSTYPEHFEHLILVPCALSSHKISQQEYTIGIAQGAFSALGVAPDVLMAFTSERVNNREVADRIKGATGIILMGGSPIAFVELLSQSLVWQIIQEQYRSGAMLVGLGGSLVGLGALGFTPVKSKSPSPAGLDFELFDGLGLLPAHMFFPFFDDIPSAIQVRLPAAESGLLRIGIGSLASLIWEGESWSVVGEGKVALEGVDGRHYEFHAGDSISADLLPPDSVR